MNSVNTITNVPTPTGRGKILVALMLTMGMAAMDATIVSTAIPSIVHDLGGFSLFAWVFSLYVLIQSITIPIYGKLADLYGRKPILIVGILIFLAGSVLSGFSWNMLTLIIFRGVQGIGAGAMQPVVFTIAGDLYTIKERARVQGWLSSVWGISAVIGPAIGGFFSQYASWRWIFFINVPIGAAALFLLVTYLREDVQRQQHRIDYGGAALLAVGAGLLIFGLLEGGVQWSWLSAQSLAVFLVAAVALVAFIWQERRAAEPTMPPWVFGRRMLVGANLSGATVGLLAIGLTTFLPTYAQGVLGVGAVVAGFILAAMSITWPLSSTLSGRIYLRIGFRNTALIGVAFTLCSCLVFVTLPRTTPVWVTVTGSLLMGAGLGLMNTPLLVGVQSVVGWNRRGVVTSGYMFTQQLGEAVGAAIFGSVANSSLATWLHAAPVGIARQIPTSVNAASQVLGGGSRTLSATAISYIQQGLYLATHQVFLGLLLIAAAGGIVVLLTPRHFDTLHFKDEKEEHNSAGKPGKAKTNSSLSPAAFSLVPENEAEPAP